MSESEPDASEAQNANEAHEPNGTNAAPAQDAAGQLQQLIDEIRPYLQGDGGDCELIDFDQLDGTVQLRFVGACGGCPSATATLKLGIENFLKEHLPWVREVVQVF